MLLANGARVCCACSAAKSQKWTQRSLVCIGSSLGVVNATGIYHVLQAVCTCGGLLAPGSWSMSIMLTMSAHVLQGKQNVATFHHAN